MSGEKDQYVVGVHGQDLLAGDSIVWYECKASRKTANGENPEVFL